MRVGADVGGTFTDIVAQQVDGTVTVRKVLSSPPAYEKAVLDVTRSLLDELGVDAGSVSAVVHGTTVATNTVLEHRGSRTALVTTRGFRDVLELRRLRMPHMSVEAFEVEHERVYGVRYDDGALVEVRAARLAVVHPEPSRPVAAPPAPHLVRVGTHRVAQVDGHRQRVEVVSRSALPVEPLAGPILVDEYDTTIVVPPEWSVRREPRHECVILELAR